MTDFSRVRPTRLQDEHRPAINEPIDPDTFHELIRNDDVLFSNQNRLIYSFLRPSSEVMLDDPGITTSAYELDYYLVDDGDGNVGPGVTVDEAMTSWKTYCPYLVYLVPTPIPGYDGSVVNDPNCVGPTPSDAPQTIEARGGLRVRWWGKNIRVCWDTYLVTDLPGNGPWTATDDGRGRVLDSVGDWPPGTPPEAQYREFDLPLPAGAKSGDLVLVFGYFSANPLEDDEEWGDRRHWLAGTAVYEYPPVTRQVRVVRTPGTR